MTSPYADIPIGDYHHWFTDSWVLVNGEVANVKRQMDNGNLFIDSGDGMCRIVPPECVDIIRASPRYIEMPVGGGGTRAVYVNQKNTKTYKKGLVPSSFYANEESLRIGYTDDDEYCCATVNNEYGSITRFTETPQRFATIMATVKYRDVSESVRILYQLSYGSSVAVSKDFALSTVRGIPNGGAGVVSYRGSVIGVFRYRHLPKHVIGVSVEIPQRLHSLVPIIEELFEDVSCI